MIQTRGHLYTPYKGENTGLRTRVAVAPGVEPVSQIEAKNWARIDDTTDNDIVTMLIESARYWAEEYLGHSIVRQQRISQWKTFAEEVPLPYGPHVSVDKVWLIHLDDTPVRWTEGTDYYVLGLLEHGSLAEGWASIFPSTVYGGEGINAYGLRVEYTAGWSTTAAGVPDLIRHAILEQIAWRYDKRNGGNSKSGEQLLDQFKEMRGRW